MRSELDELAPLAVAGDPDAITRTYEVTVDMLSGVAFGMVGDRSLAQDIVQDVFLAFIRSTGSIRASDGPTLRAWLVTAVRNRAVDHHRRAATRYEESSNTFPETAEAEESGSRGLAVQDPLLLEALRALTNDQREAIVLFHVAGLSGEEVAEAMSRRRSAVYRLLRRAEESMRRALAGSDHGTSFRPHDERA